MPEALATAIACSLGVVDCRKSCARRYIYGHMLARHAQTLIEERLRVAPAVVLLGPRQVGKTTLARAIADARGDSARYLDLEAPDDLRRLADPARYLDAQRGRLVVVDEIQRAPGLFPVLRGLIDARRRRGDRIGHFLLLGSASLDLLRQSSESLAGRASYVELGPIDARELPAAGDPDLERLWVRGGYPESLLAPDDRTSLRWRRDLIRTYLEREVPFFAPRLPAATVERCWRMLAHGQASLLNQARLASGLGVAASTVTRYIDLLADLLLIRRLPPWSGNVGKRLVKSPKVYVRDAGLVHALLDLGSWHDVTGHPVAGASWEGMVLETLLAAAGDRFTASFYRTADGAEVDLVLERGTRVAYCIEIKRSTAPTASRGLRLAVGALEPERALVVHAGAEQWPMDDQLTAMPVRAAAEALEAEAG
ncbi:MAG: ATP-binding protein [Gemmatimonadales bacterium]|nr:ATP-binding protein [Gemmatimonadales bacterium]